MQVHLPNRQDGGSGDQLDGNWRDVDDTYKAFSRLNKKVKTEKLVKNFAKQVQKEWSVEASRDALRTSLREIKQQFESDEGVEVLPQTTIFLESLAHLTESKRDVILKEILFFAQLVAKKTVEGSVKCSASLAVSQLRKLATFFCKEIRREKLDTPKAREKYDEIKSKLIAAEENCKRVTGYIEEYDLPKTSEDRKKILLNLIRKERDIILSAYKKALKEMGKKKCKKHIYSKKLIKTFLFIFNLTS